MQGEHSVEAGKGTEGHTGRHTRGHTGGHTDVHTEEEHKVLKKALNVAFLSTGALLLLSVVAVVLFTAIR